MIKIGILDYGVGNLFSIQTALEKLGVTTIVTSELDANLEYDGIILPGVGGWKHAVKRIQVNQRILNDYYENNKPILAKILLLKKLINIIYLLVSQRTYNPHHELFLKSVFLLGSLPIYYATYLLKHQQTDHRFANEYREDFLLKTHDLKHHYCYQ